MIEYLRGELAELQPTVAVVECYGVGYEVNISLTTYSAIQGKKEVKLYIYEVIREDTHQLFGFVSRAERSLFLLLTSVRGIAGNTARTILSSLSARELTDVIMTENISLLQSVKGIGKKTAERIIVELKDKIAQVSGQMSGVANVEMSGGGVPSALAVQHQVSQEAVAALTMLGFQPAATQKAVQAILMKHPSAVVEEVVKIALKQL